MNRNEILIEADELLTKIEKPNLRIYDASIMDDMYQQGHIPGAAFFDHEKFSDPNNAYEYMLLPDNKLAARIGDIGISNENEVVVYACGMLPYAACWTWHRSSHTAKMTNACSPPPKPPCRQVTPPAWTRSPAC